MSPCLVSSRVLCETLEERQRLKGELIDLRICSLPQVGSSFHCCLSQDSITCTCLSPLLSSVLLELCSSGLPPNLVKRELASTPTLSLDFLTKLRVQECRRGLQVDAENSVVDLARNHWRSMKTPSWPSWAMTIRKDRRRGSSRHGAGRSRRDSTTGW